MAVSFQGRVEALLTVPTGGALVSASNGAQSAAVNVTVPAASYYLTQAGGVSSLLTTLQTQLNANVQGYPTTAAAMPIATGGYGTFSSGWLMNESSGTLTDSFGAANLAVSVGTSVYGNAGPSGGIDKAISFDTSTDQFSAGDVLDAGGDIVLVWVAKLTQNGANADFLGKGWGTAAGGQVQYLLARESNGLSFYAKDSAGGTYSSTVSAYVGEWHVGVAALDRATGRLRIATYGLTTRTASAGANTAFTLPVAGNAQNFVVGNAGAYTADLNLWIAALYAGPIATGIPDNITTVVTNIATAILSSWSVATSTTTGLTTISNSFWPSSVSFTSTDLRDVLGYAYNFDYPQTPAQLTAALGGYGTFTGGAGYLCNESSGNLAAVFGTPATLTAASTPTYSNQGARGGGDKAVGFDSAADAFNGGTSDFDIGTGDMIVVFVGKWTAVPGATATVVSKAAAAVASGWGVWALSPTNYSLFVVDAGGVKNSDVGNVYYTGQPHVGIGVVDRSTGKLRFGITNLITGASTVGTETTISGTITTAANFTLGASAWVSGLTSFQLSALYVATGSGVATGLSANLSTALSNFATYMKSQTSTKQARSLWLPSCPFNIDDDPRTAPLDTDAIKSQGPTGIVITHVGNEKYKHTNARWEAVPINRYRAASAEYVNGSFEEFWEQTQLGKGNSWQAPGSQLQIYYDENGTATAVGSDESISGWYVVAGGGLKDVARRREQGWTGYWTITFPTLVSSG